LHLIGYFYWFILRCTDPWILNIPLYTKQQIRNFNSSSTTNIYVHPMGLRKGNNSEGIKKEAELKTELNEIPFWQTEQ
jgi:hypothetical protein